jgi:protein arginine N-methyltransferase 1
VICSRCICPPDDEEVGQERTVADEYSLIAYGHMIKPGRRRDAYVQAMREHIRPGALVVDVGAGFGFFSVLAAKMGAAQVFAVEPGEAVLIGNRLAQENGVADRVTFVRGKVEELELPRPADLIISDLRGALPIHAGHLSAIAAARALLAPSGVLLPHRDTLMVAAIDDEKACAQWHDPWLSPQEGITLAAVHALVVNEWSGARLSAEGLLGAAAPWASIDYRTVTNSRVQGSASLRITRAGTLRGLGMWFDAEIAPGITLSNHPGAERLVYGQAVFPISAPLGVEAGAQVDVQLSVTPVADGHDWSWSVKVTHADGALLCEERHHSMLSRALPALIKQRAVEMGGP